MPKKHAKVLQYMLDHPRWYYATDLVNAGVASRWSLVSDIYKILEDLEDGGFIETREEPPTARAPLGRTAHRATGKRAPDDGLTEGLVAT